MSGSKRNQSASSSPQKRQKQQGTAIPVPAPAPTPAPSASASKFNPETQQAKLESSRDKILDIVKLIHDSGFTLDMFLNGLCYGNPLACDHGSLRKARRDLWTSELLPKILDNLHMTPRTGSRGQQAPGAVEPLETWATKMIEGVYREELMEFSKEMHCNVLELINEET
ncbi:hypothetical protein FRC11_002361, partial [Ceratobasidium sp. 423]